MEPPRVVPHRTKEWTTDQPKHEVLPSLPCRLALVGPSGSGKTQLIQSLIMDMYRTKRGKSCFARIYVWSPSVHVDPAWEPVIDFCRHELHQDDKKEPFLFDSYNPSDMEKVISTHKEVVAAGKNAEYKKCGTCCSSSTTSPTTRPSVGKSGSSGSSSSGAGTTRSAA